MSNLNSTSDPSVVKLTKRQLHILSFAEHGTVDYAAAANFWATFEFLRYKGLLHHNRIGFALTEAGRAVLEAANNG